MTADEVRAATGFALEQRTEVSATPPPTVQELNLLAEVMVATGDVAAAGG